MNAVPVGCGGYAARCLDYCLLSGWGFLDLEAYFVRNYFEFQFRHVVLKFVG
jgi:hypothetical protein